MSSLTSSLVQQHVSSFSWHHAVQLTHVDVACNKLVQLISQGVFELAVDTLLQLS